MDVTETETETHYNDADQQAYDAFNEADQQAYEGAVFDQNCTAGELSYHRDDLGSDLDGLTAEAQAAEEQGEFVEAYGYRTAAAEIEQDLALIQADLALVRSDGWLRDAVAANARMNAYNAAAFSAAAQTDGAGRD